MAHRLWLVNEQLMDIVTLLHEQGLSRPKRLTVSITSNCNLRCEHCWIECDWLEKQGLFAPTVEVVRLIREFVDIGGEEVCLTGGEPLTHPGFPDILDVSLATKLQAVHLQTNATLLGHETLQGFAAHDTCKLHFQVSLDGASTETHDLVRGPGSFKSALTGLAALTDGGYGARTTIGFTEMQHNMHEVPQLLRLASSMGVGSVVGWSLVDFGKAQYTESLAPPTPEQYVNLLELYQSDLEFRSAYDKHGTFAAIEWFKGRDHSTGHACRFIEKPYLSASGKLYPCTLLQNDAYAAHDVYNRNLASALSEMSGDWGRLRELTVKHSQEPGCLKDCRGARHCAGGCFARAVADGDGQRRGEDRCRLRCAVYQWGRDN